MSNEIPSSIATEARALADIAQAAVEPKYVDPTEVYSLVLPANAQQHTLDLEIAQSVQGKTKADWKTARRLDNGEVSFAYQEEIQASAGRSGHLEIPATFTLAIAPFYGEQPYEISARLRYRIREGHLSIGYKLDRPHEVLLAVLGGIAVRLREQDGFANVYMGAPR